jgi:hypothetical protein
VVVVVGAFLLSVLVVCLVVVVVVLIPDLVADQQILSSRDWKRVQRPLLQGSREQWRRGV